MKQLLEPERILLGSEQTPAALEAIDTIAAIYAHWVPADKILKSLTWSAELAKLVTNAMLAQRISSVNAVAAVCEAIERYLAPNQNPEIIHNQLAQNVKGKLPHDALTSREQ